MEAAHITQTNKLHVIWIGLKVGSFRFSFDHNTERFYFQKERFLQTQVKPIRHNQTIRTQSVHRNSLSTWVRLVGWSYSFRFLSHDKKCNKFTLCSFSLLIVILCHLVFLSPPKYMFLFYSSFTVLYCLHSKTLTLMMPDFVLKFLKQIVLKDLDIDQVKIKLLRDVQSVNS